METKDKKNKVGRPRNPNDNKILKHFKVKLTDKEYERLEQVAIENNRTITNQVQYMIQQLNK